MTNLACVLWWLIPGMFLGWLLSWLFDLMFRRNGVPLLETAQSETAAALARAKGLESELAASRSELSHHSDSVKRLTADLTNTRSAHEQAQGSLGLLKSELDQRNSSLAKYTSDLSALQGQFTATQHGSAQLEAALAASKGEAQAAQGRYEVAHRNLEAMQRELAAAKSEIGASKTADSQHSASAAAEIAKLRSELAAALSARDNVQHSLSLIETERSNVKSSFADLSGEADRLRAEIAAAKTASAGSSAELPKLKAQIAVLHATQDENGQLKDQLAGLNKQILTLREAVGGHKASFEKATRDSEQLKADLAAARAHAAKLELVEREHAALLNTHEEHKVAFGKLRAEHDEKSNLVALLQADIEGNKHRHEALSGRVSDIERAAHLEAERRIAMTRHGFVSRTKDRDDLTLVEGIGPKIEEVLLAAGVNTHAKLAVTPVEELRLVLDGAGPSFKIANPGTWPRQAALIVRNDWAELRRWQDVLIAGVELPVSKA